MVGLCWLVGWLVGWLVVCLFVCLFVVVVVVVVGRVVAGNGRITGLTHVFTQHKSPVHTEYRESRGQHVKRKVDAGDGRETTHTPKKVATQVRHGIPNQKEILRGQ